MYDLRIRRRTQAQTRLGQSGKDDVRSFFTRNFRANHLGSNLRPGAEAQFVHHAIQTRRQRLVLQLQRFRPQLRLLHAFLQGIDVDPLTIDSAKELVLFLVDVGVPRPVAICHGLSIRLDLG